MNSQNVINSIKYFFFQINDMIFKDISKKLNYNVNWKQIVIQE